jgi:hypothetical protein
VAFDGQIASIYKICHFKPGPDIKPIRVSFEHPEPACVEQFEQYFGIPVIFNAIEFDKKISELPESSASPDLTRINDQIVIH